MGTSLSTVTGDVDELLLRGGTYMFYAHDIADTEVNANQWETSKLTGFIDYVAAKRDAGLLDVMTITEWYALALSEYKYGCYAPCDSTLPTDGQIFKSHTAPIAAKKLTVFPGVASAGQIREAAE